MVVRRAHHGNLDALIAQPSDTSGPLSFDRGPPFELETELAKEINRRCEVIDDDSDVVHPFKRHVSTLLIGHEPLERLWDSAIVRRLSESVRSGMFGERSPHRISPKEMMPVGADEYHTTLSTPSGMGRQRDEADAIG